MYARRQSLPEFRQENQELNNLKLQAFALQQKNIGNKEEIVRAQSETQKVKEQLDAERIRTQKIKDAEKAAKGALQEKEAQAARLAIQVEEERKRVQEAVSSEQSAKAALQEKSSQMDRLTTQLNTLTGQLNDVQTRAVRLETEQEATRRELRAAQIQTPVQAEAITTKSVNHPAPKENSTKYVVLSSELLESKLRHVPYVFEITAADKSTIIKDSTYYYYIEDDEIRGLGSPGRSGYIKNDGAGDITYRLYNKQQDTWSYPTILRAGEADVFEYGDNIRVNTVEIIPNSNQTIFRLKFSAGIEQVFKEAEV